MKKMVIWSQQDLPIIVVIWEESVWLLLTKWFKKSLLVEDWYQLPNYRMQNIFVVTVIILFLVPKLLDGL